MSGRCARPVAIDGVERRRLEAEVARLNVPFWLAQRCRTILLLADGSRPADVVRQLGVTDRFVRKWRSRWEQRSAVEGLFDADRPGRPAQISLAAKCRVVQLACELPADRDAACRSTWTQQALADAVSRLHRKPMSRSTVQRILSAEGLRPHRVRYWLHSPDPCFVEKVEKICGLYLNPPDDAVVLCVDEKPMQALKRIYPAHVAAGGFVRREYEYRRGGVCQLLGAFDIRTGRVFGRVVRHRTEKALLSFVDGIARQFPGRRVIVVWDNLNIHHDGKRGRWTRFNQEHGHRFEFVHTPIHASWVNQIEIWFSILQRRLLRHGSFSGIAELRERVLRFISHWNRHEAGPFRWTFSGRFVQTPERLVA